MSGGSGASGPQAIGAATLTAAVRSVLLATVMLLLAAPAASAAATVSVKFSPIEAQFGDPTKVTGTVFEDGVPAAGRAVQLEGKGYPFSGAAKVLATATTADDGTFAFSEKLDRNTVLQVTTPGAVSPRKRVYVFPATTLTFRARGAREIKLTQRFVVPRGVKLEQPTLFYVGPRGKDRAPRAGSGTLKRTRPGRYRATAIVKIPAAWNGRFRYASCFRYTGGSGMGNPRASCPRRFKF
jgi:hypothetical protein